MLIASKSEAAAYEATRNGAYGYLLEDLSAPEFVRLMEGLGREEPVLSQGVARKLLGEFRQYRGDPDTESHPEALTGREQDVLRLLVQGVTTTEELSARLVVSDNTIKFHLRNILDKLHVHNRAEVVVVAGRYHLAPPVAGKP